MNSTESHLEISNLTLRRGGMVVLNIPSLTLLSGGILSLIGPNGAGKSSLLMSLACLLKPSQGEILFKGLRIGGDLSLLDYRRRIAFVFQEPLLFDATVSENVASGLKIRGMTKDGIRTQVTECLERFGIQGLGDRSAKKISGGEAQRTSLARAFAIRPEILFLDEPFSSLDQPTRESLIGDLERILRETGMTAVLATHDRDEALRLSDRIAVMQDGRIVQIGTPEDVMNQPVNEFVASFVGTETILTGRVTGINSGTFFVSVAGQNIEAVGEAQMHESVILCIRPENVIVSANTPSAQTSARNVLPARIEKIIPVGPLYKVHLQCGFPLVAFVTHHAREDLSLREGMEVRASFKATAIHAIRRTTSS